MANSHKDDDELVNWLRSALPDVKYFAGLFARYRYLILLIGALTLSMAVIGYNLVKNKYSSDISIAIKADNRTMVSRILDPVNIREHIDSFTSLTRSQKFLGEVYDRMQREGIINDNSLERELPFAKVKRKVKTFYLSIKGQKFDADNERFNSRLRAIDRLFESFVAYSTETGVLTIEAIFDSPDKAQRLAQLIMHHYILTELESEITYLEGKAQSLKQNMELSKLSLNQARKSLNINLSKDEEEFVNRRETELEISEKVRDITSEINSLALEKTRTRMGLEAEYKRLSTMLQPDHPTLVAKRKEIMTPAPDDFLDSKEKVREGLKAKLKELRRKASSKDPMLDAALGDTAYNVNLLTNGLNEIEIEKEKIIKDLLKPDQSTLFRTIKAPSLNVKPYINLKIKVALGIITVGVVALILGIFLGEYFSQRARDEWRIRRIAGKDILARLPRVKIDDIKGEEELLKQWVIGKVSASVLRKGYIRGILENRAFEISLTDHCRGRSVFIAELTDVSKCSHYIKNFLNIFSKDQAKNAVVFDFNFVSPLLPKNLYESGKHKQIAVQPAKGSAHGPISFLVGKTVELHFDYISSQYGDLGVHFLKEEYATAVFADLKKSYEWVFIMGFPASFMVENRKLQKFASDTIVFVDCQWSRYAVLNRMVQDLEQESVRGIALLEAAA